MKKLFLIFLLTGIFSSSFAQSYHPPLSSNDNGSYTVKQNRDEKAYDRNNSGNSPYGYNNQRNSRYDNERGYCPPNDRRTSDKRYDQRDENRRDRRVVVVHHENHGYPERRNSKNNNAKVFGGGLIIGGILGVLIGSSH